ncbi:rRNA maturation RNase YbeY [Entomomonas asaccharolytica]|uniref:Endoribonuclease YbeY n=1 Tax=Entomomonas asaccharolytica TaxID=2785331 RepID=A0A974RYE5_9GAMM|nr:rRNA maturation RNase YbeY [Entomomonas asaccharolytica]QQP85804.1 rRNA maturation RNase YbeY [Entomomonas asaccharolytica]
MSIELDLQLASEEPYIPDASLFLKWCEAAITPYQEHAELTIRIVDEAEGQALNATYRCKDYATNVLSFPSELPEGILDIPLLGDLIICAPVVTKEAEQQQKSLEAHWAHLVTHGCLHLLGFDHEEQQAATEMETLEQQLLMKQGYPDPYQEVN